MAVIITIAVAFAIAIVLAIIILVFLNKKESFRPCDYTEEECSAKSTKAGIIYNPFLWPFSAESCPDNLPKDVPKVPNNGDNSQEQEKKESMSSWKSNGRRVPNNTYEAERLRPPNSSNFMKRSVPDHDLLTN